MGITCSYVYKVAARATCMKIFLFRSKNLESMELLFLIIAFVFSTLKLPQFFQRIWFLANTSSIAVNMSSANESSAPDINYISTKWVVTAFNLLTSNENFNAYWVHLLNTRIARTICTNWVRMGFAMFHDKIEALWCEGLVYNGWCLCSTWCILFSFLTIRKSFFER